MGLHNIWITFLRDPYHCASVITISTLGDAACNRMIYLFMSIFASSNMLAHYLIRCISKIRRACFSAKMSWTNLHSYALVDMFLQFIVMTDPMNGIVLFLTPTSLAVILNVL